MMTRLNMINTTPKRTHSKVPASKRWASLSRLAYLVTIGVVLVAMSRQTCASDDKSGARSTQPTLERQVDAPSAAPAAPKPSSESSPMKPKKENSLASQKKAAALAAQQNYDKYQLKATNSYASTQPIAAPAASPPAGSPEKAATVEKSSNSNDNLSNNGSAPNKKAGSLLVGQANNQKQKSSSFSLLKKLFPSFMSSPSASSSSSSSSAIGSVAAAAAAATMAAVSSSDNRLHAGQHSRSTGDGPFSKHADAGSRIVNFWRRNSSSSNHAPTLSFLLPKKQAAIDRQALAGGGAAASIASGLLSNPLGLGLLFSAPLLPSLLLTPLAIAGLSPAMSAINNFFGDDDETSSPAPSGPLAALAGASGSNSALASILQATGALPSPVVSQASSSSSSNSQDGGSSPSPSASFAMQAFQTLLGQPSTTERPLFNPGMFASGIQNAAGALTSGSSSASSSSPAASAGNALASAIGSSSGSSQPTRNSFFGSNLIQTAASMISPSFAAPPAQASGSTSGSGAANNNNNVDDDGPGLMQMASGVFEKVANFMGTDNNSNKDIAQASSSPQPANAPLSTLAALSSFSPFQLSSLFGPTPLGSAVSAASSHHHGNNHHHHHIGSAGHQNTQRAGFFSTLRNVYELFSSSFLRRQAEMGDNSNECQQRLICELHQRAMNSKLFRRSVQANLMELANIDKSMLEQLKLMPPFAQARVDSDTKAMLNDFLKATNNYRNGRELINCSRMFPKCSRAQLLVAANAHLSDPINGKAIGKFSQLMKKMKYKSNQQHQSQWKLRKSPQSSSKPVLLNGQVSPVSAASNAPMDFMQVAPLSPTLNSQQSQLSPADSLKLVQQIMLMSQMNQQQQQQSYAQQPQPQQQMVAAPQQYVAAVMPANSQYRSQQPNGYSTSAATQYSNSYNQYPSQAPSTTYTDAVYPPATDSPYYLPQQQQPQQPPQQQYVEQPSQISQQQPQQQPIGQQQQVLPTNQNYQPASVTSIQDDKSKSSAVQTNQMGSQPMKVAAVAA